MDATMARTDHRMTSRVLMCWTQCGVASLVLVLWLQLDCCLTNSQPMETLTLEPRDGEINSAELRMQQ